MKENPGQPMVVYVGSRLMGGAFHVDEHPVGDVAALSAVALGGRYWSSYRRPQPDHHHAYKHQEPILSYFTIANCDTKTVGNLRRLYLIPVNGTKCRPTERKS
jgi:hypothetical protein